MFDWLDKPGVARCVYPFSEEGFDADPRSSDDLEQTRAYVRSVAIKYVRDDQDAEDVTQDAMLLAHRYRESFRGESRYSTWLYRVTATAALMFLRKQRRLAREMPASGARDEEGTPWLERQPRRRTCAPRWSRVASSTTCREAVAELGAKYPAVFWKRYGEGRTETEIAQGARALRRGGEDARVPGAGRRLFASLHVEVLATRVAANRVLARTLVD